MGVLHRSNRRPVYRATTNAGLFRLNQNVDPRTDVRKETALSMLKQLIAPSGLLSLVAIFIALSGWGAYAAVTAQENSVVSRSVKDGSLRAGTSRTTR